MTFVFSEVAAHNEVNSVCSTINAITAFWIFKASFIHQVLDVSVVVVVHVARRTKLELNAFEVVTQYEVNNTCYSVSAVYSRCTTGQNFNALNHRCWNLVYVGRC